jgi:lipoprotein-anchoring transpeptidase ErfK/SrfK
VASSVGRANAKTKDVGVVKAIPTGRRLWVTVGLLGASVVGAGTFVGVQAAQKPSVTPVSPARDGAIARARPSIVVALDNVDRIRDLAVSIDGRDVTKSVTGADGRLVITPPKKLADGEHDVAVRFDTSNLLARTVSERWTFEVDTKAPDVAVKSPEPSGLSKRRTVTFTGTGETAAEVDVAWKGGSTNTAVGDDGTWSVDAKLPEGRVDATVSVRDRAGNTTTAQRSLIVDTVAPTLSVSAPKTAAVLTETDEPLVYGTIGRDDPTLLNFAAIVNGEKASSIPGAAGLPVALADGELIEAAGSTAPLVLEGKKFAFAVGALPQGTNTVQVRVRDRAGNIAKKTLNVTVDSTEEFGAFDMRRGARGADARVLNARLKAAKFLKGKVDSRFTARTEKALKRYQKKRGVAVTGVVDTRTREAMVGRIVISISQRRLRLIRDGKVAISYRVAVGQAAYPTPTGTYEIIDKQVDPAWFPPDSPWAKGLGSIPPGPGNPLGTRWIGTSAPAIGIHGTYADSSIGTAASHGCLRMHIPEVEALYEQVTLGMPVEIRA